MLATGHPGTLFLHMVDILTSYIGECQVNVTLYGSILIPSPIAITAPYVLLVGKEMWIDPAASPVVVYAK